MRKGFWQLSGSAAPWRRGRACLLLDSAPRRAITASCRCCHPLQQWYLALILIWNVHGSAFEMAGVVLTRSLLSICLYGWEVHPMDHFFFLDDGNRPSSRKQPFPCFASACGTAVTICLTLAGSKGWMEKFTALLNYSKCCPPARTGRVASVLLLAMAVHSCLPPCCPCLCWESTSC